MRKEKQLLLDEMKGHIDNSNAFVLLSYQGIDPNYAAGFRRMIHDTGGWLTVVKKRVFLKAAEEAGISLDWNALKGHVAIVYATEKPVETTKVIYQFKKEQKDAIEILSGRFEGKNLSADDVLEISKLPSRDELRASFLGLLEAPMAQTLSVINSLLTSVPHCLEQKAPQEEV